MTTKRFILMLLVMLGSVTGVWAAVSQMGYTTLQTDFTQTPHGSIGSDYTCNGDQAKMVIKTNYPIILTKIKVAVWDSWSETSPNSIKIEGSNDQSEWNTLADRTLTNDAAAVRYASVSTTEFYQYFRLTLYGVSGSSVVLRDIFIYGEGLAGDGTSQNPYLLDKISYLKQYAAFVAGGNNTACAKLVADLDLDDIDWSPIDNANFKGTIDGDGHSIKNLNNANGLFKNIGAATIKYLTIENATLSTTDAYSGAFASQANGTNFQNCTVKGTISAGSTNTGGLVGNAIGCKFTDCKVSGLNATGTTFGGLAGNANGATFTSCNVEDFTLNNVETAGGLVGNAKGATFTQCSVSSDITTSGCTTVGGLAGITDNSTTSTNCNVLNFSINDVENAGGLVGNANGATLTSCNVEVFTANNVATAGGLVANANGATLTSCNVEVFTANNVATAGGLVANAKGATFTTCLVLSDITAVGCTTVGGLAGKTTNNATFTKCYSIGNYSVGSANAGALVGNTEGSSTFNQCYAATNLDMDDDEMRPTFISSTNTGSYQNQPAQNLVDNRGVDTRWIANKTDMVAGVWNIVVTTGIATQLKTIKLWNADNQTYPKRRWKSMKVYGSASTNGEWTEIGVFPNLQLEANNKGLAGEIAINATEEYAYYRIDVLDNEGDDYMQMSDMKFVVTSLRLPVCGSSDGSCTATQCYHYGSTSSAMSSPVEKVDVASGHLAFLLNNGNAAGPYFQRIGTDAYPSLMETANSYVYLALDGVNYTNTCPHRDYTITPFQAPTCHGTNGNAEYGKCKNGLCGKYFPTSDRNAVSTNTTNFILSNKAVKIQDHYVAPGKGIWTYSMSKTISGATYHRVMDLYIVHATTCGGDYEFFYTSMDDDPTMKLHLFFYSELEDGEFSIRFYVNGTERPALRKDYTDYVSEHEVVTIDGLHKWDRINVVFNYKYAYPTVSEQYATLTVGTEKPEEKRNHNLHKHELSYNCIDGGHKEYYECEYCNRFLTQDTPLNDNNLTTWSNLVLAPVGAHNFGAANPDKQKEGNLYGVQCQNEHCTTFDPDHYVLRNYHNDTDLPLTYDGSTYSTSSALSLTDGKAYVTPVAFDAPSLTYSRNYPENVWSAWCTPFDVNASYLTSNGLTPAYIEGIHNYDDDEDGTIDRTVMEIVKISNGRLRAGTPLLVRAAEGYSPQLELKDVTMMASDDLNNIHTETATAKYDFLGTFTGTTAAAADNMYSLDQTGAMVHRTGTILPLRWYCQIEQKPSFIGEESPALARTIYIKVIGEEDQETGIRTLYDEADQREERADGIFDLSGRKLLEPQHGKINIINGKKQFVR